MGRSIAVVLALTLLTSASSTSVSAQSPPPYPEDVRVEFVPVNDSTWQVLERDLDCEREPFLGADERAIAPDGRLWLFDRARGIRELGSCPLDVQGYSWNFGIRDHAMAPDGTRWVLDIDRLMSWGGSDWVVHLAGAFNLVDCGGKTWAEVQDSGGECRGVCEERGCFAGLDIAPDGTVWLWGDRLASFDGKELQVYQEAWISGGPVIAGFSPESAVWVYGADGLYLFDP